MKNNPLFFVLFCIGILFFSSCKTDKSETKTKQNSSAINTETTVTVRLSAETDRLNPFLTTRGHNTQVMYYMFPTVLAYDPYTLELSPFLAKSRPVTEDITEGPRKGWTRYNYELLDEAVWDDGSPVTGYDYLYTMKALFNPHSGSGAGVYRAYLNLIKDIEVDATNPKKYTVYTNENYIKSEFATGLFILPKYKYDPEKVLDKYEFKEMRDEAFAKQLEADEVLKVYGEKFNSPEYSRDINLIGGCGAYKVEEWVEGERIVLVKKDPWWGEAIKDNYPLLTANPKRIVFKPIVDATTALSMMKDGELDIVRSVPDEQFDEFKASEIGQKDFDFSTPSSLGYAYYGLNMKRPKLEDKRTRKALAHLINLDEIFKSVKPYGERVVGPYHPSRSYYNKSLQAIKLNIEKAKKLLAEVGWKDSNNNGILDQEIDGALVELELKLLIPPGKTHTSIALIFQNEAKKAGVRINISEQQSGAFFAELRSRDFDVYGLGTSPDVELDDPKQFWHTESDTPQGQNRFGFGNAETDQLIDEIRSELDQTKRDALYRKFQEILHEEQPAIFLFSSRDRIVINKRLDGADVTLKKPGYFVNYWYENKKVND